MRSAFGVDNHGAAIVRKVAGSSSDKDRAKHYGRMAATSGALGGLSSAVGVGSAAIGQAEFRGRDPMKFVQPMTPGGRKVTKPMRAKLLRGTAEAHGRQAVAMGGIGAASLGIAGAYKHKQKKALAKALKPETKRKAGDAALGAGATGIAGGATWAGVHHGKHMGEDVKAAVTNVHRTKQYIKAAPEHAAFYRNLARGDKMVAGVKGSAVAAGLGAAGLGAAGVGELARYHAKNKKRSVMAKSAFGVDHGHEFAKAGGSLTRLGTKLGEKTMSAGIKVQDRGAAMAAKAKKAGSGGYLGQAQLAEGHLQAGGAMHRMGTSMAARPGLTGGLAVGGAGTTGVGGAAALGRKKRS